MNEKCLFLTSVGTSFCQKNEIRGFTAGGIEDLNDLKNALRSNTFFFPNFNLDSFTGWNDIAINISNGAIKTKEHSAEIDSLLKRELCEGDWVVLLCSMTVDCLYSGLAVRKYLIKNELCSKVDIEVVEGLVEAKETNFGKVGLPSFLNVLYEYVKKGEQNGYKVVLNPTGGYKSLFSAITIIGLIAGREIIYLFEKSDHLVTIPPLPLHVNIPAWTQVESIVDLLADKKDYHKNRIYTDVKDKIEAILIEKDPAKGLEASALVRAFCDYSSKERGKPELITRTENSPLLTFLNPNERRLFLRLTQVGHLIWKGDRVPEMVDHALRHHSDIFHIAERLLLPIFYYKKDFLESHELFALLCALYLHDCGHVIGAIKKKDGNFLPLLPTEIRDHHHVLGYLRLRYPKQHSYLGYLIYDHLCETRAGDSDRNTKWDEAWNNYLHTIATLGLYHRKRMKLAVDKNYEFFKAYPIEVEDCDKDFLCLKKHLEKSPVKVFGNKIGCDRVALLVALLRIIDGLDEQVSRTGDVNDIRFHLAQLEAEAEEQNRRAGMLKSSLDNKAQTKIEKLLKRLEIRYRIDEDKWFKPTENIKKKAIDAQAFRQKVNKLKLDKVKKGLAFEYSSAYMGHFFKKFPIGPYAEKAYIRSISINAEKADEKVRIKIDLNVEDDPGRLNLLSKFAKVKLERVKLDMTQTSDRDKYKESMLKALKKEYLLNEGSEREPCTVVKSALNNAGIEFQYGQEDS